MRILGISAFQGRSAAALIEDGRVIAAAYEERFTRKHHDSTFPKRAARFCLERGGIASPDLDKVVFYEKPLRKFERLLVNQLRSFPKSAGVFSTSMFVWLGDRLWMKNRIVDELGVPTDRIAFAEHLRSHAAAAYFGSGFEESAVLVVDDAGEWATTGLLHGKGAKLEVLGEVHFPHSLGLFAGAITQFLGFEPGADEGQIEALASYGTPKFQKELEALIPQEADGSFKVDPKPFRYAYDSEQTFGPELESILGPARASGSPLRYLDGDTRDADVAASLQCVLEERVLGLARALHGKASTSRLCLGGRLASNARLVRRLLEEGPFDEVYVPPACDEAGAAMGAALELSAALAPESVQFGSPISIRVGEAIDDRAEGEGRDLGSPEKTRGEILERLGRGERVAWVRGAQEFSPHTVGGRSLLADPRKEDASHLLLESVQRAEAWQVCGLAVTAEAASDLFELPEKGAGELLANGMLRVPMKDAAAEAAPSAVAPDRHALVWVIDRDRDPEMHSLLEAFGEHSGTPILLHTDFALRGQPLVRGEIDAVEAFGRSGLEALFVESRCYDRS